VDLRGGRVAWLAETDTGGNGFADFHDVLKSYAWSLASQIREDHVLATQQEIDTQSAQHPAVAPGQPTPAASVAPPTPSDTTAAAPKPTEPASSLSLPSKSEPLATRLEGCVIAGQDGQFLGKITANASDPDSVINDRGANVQRPTRRWDVGRGRRDARSGAPRRPRPGGGTREQAHW